MYLETETVAGDADCTYTNSMLLPAFKYLIQAGKPYESPDFVRPHKGP